MAEEPTTTTEVIEEIKPDPAPAWLKPAFLALSVIILAVMIYSSTNALWHNQYDDSYITYRYAVNLAEHGQLVFNLGERVDAASSHLYAVVLAMVYRVGFHNLEKASFILNMIALGAITWLIYLMVMAVTGIGWQAVFLGMAVPLHGFISGWSALGMETVPFTALLCALVWATLEGRRYLALSLVMLIMLARPEGILIAPFWLLALGNRDLKFSLRALWMIAALFIFYTVTKYFYYGTLIPHAYQAKAILGYYAPRPAVLLHLWGMLAITAPFLALSGAIKNTGARWLVAYIIISAVACAVGPHADWGRYAAHLFPLCIIASLPLFRDKAFAVGICCILAFQCFFSIAYMQTNIAASSQAQVLRTATGQWLNENGDNTRPVISGDIGAIAYKAMGFQFIDLIGLTSKDVLAAYRSGAPLDTIIAEKKPLYVADTFNIVGTSIIYSKVDGASLVEGGVLSKLPPLNLVWGNKINDTAAVVVAMLDYDSVKADTTTVVEEPPLATE